MDSRNNKLKDGLVGFLTAAGDIMALNILWFICSLPIITIGPATAAMFSVALKLANDDPVTVLRGFFTAFKNNFKQSLVLGAFNIFAIITLYADYCYIVAVEGFIRKLYIVIAILVVGILLIIDSYAYALIARFENTLKGHIINAFKLAFINPVQTIVMWSIYALPILMFLFIQPIVLLYIGWFFILFIFALPACFNSRILIGVFKKIEDKKEK